MVSKARGNQQFYNNGIRYAMSTTYNIILEQTIFRDAKNYNQAMIDWLTEFS